MGLELSLNNSSHVFSISAALMACSAGLLYTAYKVKSSRASSDFDGGYSMLIQSLKSWTQIKHSCGSGKSARQVNAILDCLYDAIEAYENLVEPAGSRAMMKRNNMSIDSLSADSFFSYDEDSGSVVEMQIGEPLGETMEVTSSVPMMLADEAVLLEKEAEIRKAPSSPADTPLTLKKGTPTITPALMGKDEGVEVGDEYLTPDMKGGLILSQDSVVDTEEELKIVEYDEEELLALLRLDEDLGTTTDDCPVEATDTDVFYLEGMYAVKKKQVKVRTSQADRLGCLSEDDFKAKVYCLRLAYTDLLKQSQPQKFFRTNGEAIVKSVLQKGGANVEKFSQNYQKMMAYIDRMKGTVAMELKHRHVADSSFYDIVLDFIILDAFDDLENPPNTVMSVLKSNWLPTSMKEATVAKGISTIIRTKALGMDDHSFMYNFYTLSGCVTPTLALGFLGLNERLHGPCIILKELLMGYIKEMFSLSNRKYQSKEHLQKVLFAGAIKVHRDAIERIA
eukprot:CFRG0990T1